MGEKDQLHNHWEVEVRDKNEQSVETQRKERFDPQRRFIRISFTPAAHGLHHISFKYKGAHIQDSPFLLFVPKAPATPALPAAPAPTTPPNSATISSLINTTTRLALCEHGGRDG